MAYRLKNTFIEVDEGERPAKLRRTASAPDITAGSRGSARPSVFSGLYSLGKRMLFGGGRQEERLREADTTGLDEVPSISSDSWADLTEQEYADEMAERSSNKMQPKGQPDQGGKIEEKNTQTCQKQARPLKSQPSQSRSGKQQNQHDPRGNNHQKEVNTPEERRQKRKRYIDDIKESDGYKNLLKARQAGDEKAVAAPGTPDYKDDCSKRIWEAKTAEFRICCKKWA